MRRLYWLVVVALLLIAAALGWRCSPAWADVPSIMGSGNVAGQGTYAAEYAALVTASVKVVRIGNYSYWKDGLTVPRTDIDSKVVAAYQAGLSIHHMFEYYYWFSFALPTPDQWRVIGQFYAARYKPNSAWLVSQGIRDWGITSWSAINEPDIQPIAAAFDPVKYHDSLKALADGIHSADPAAKVVPGGWAQPNAHDDYTARGLGLAIADLLNDGTLDGIDLHTYAGFYAPLLSGDNSAQHDFDAVKAACGITRDINHYATEWNYNRTLAEGGTAPSTISEELAASYSLTALWDNLCVYGQNGRPATRMCLVWTMFKTTTAYPSYGICSSLSPWVPTPRGRVWQTVAALTKGMEFVPTTLGRGTYMLRGPGRSLYVWQNRTNWAAVIGSALALPETGPCTVRVYGWDGLRGTQTFGANVPVVVTGLAVEETSMVEVSPGALAETLSYTIDRTQRLAEDVPLRAYLRRADKSGIVGKLIRFAVGATAIGSALTNSDGRATIDYQLPGPVGTQPLGVAFDGDTALGASSAVATLTTTPGVSYLWMYAKTLLPGQPAIVRALLRRRPDLVVLPGRTYTFRCNGTVVGSAVAGADGWASLTFPLVGAGPYVFTSDFAGDGQYLPSAAQVTALSLGI